VIVVDASALAAFLLKEPGWRRLAKYLVNAVSVDHVVKEVANAIWKAYALRSMVGEADALRLYQLLSSMVGVNIVVEPEERYVENALRIAMEHKVTVYDALYLALAREKNLPLLTLDKRQAQVARRLGIELVNAYSEEPSQ